MKSDTLSPWIITCFAILSLSGCTGPGESITIDGASTVFPVEAAWAEEFGRRVDARVTVAFSGTGSGFQKFCRREIDVSGASRPEFARLAPGTLNLTPIFPTSLTGI